MRRYSLLLLLLLSIGNLLASTDSTKVKNPTYLALAGYGGTVFPTTSFFDGEYAIPLYGSMSLKYVFGAAGDKWQQIAYGLPYYGIGVSGFEFGRNEDLGSPISIYLLQGATIAQLTRRMALNYELNLGLATNWVPYDPIDNPYNNAIGSVVNTHVGANLYLKWYLSQLFDIHLGASLFHASNGSSRQPNNGINTGSLFVEVAYNFNRKELANRYDASLIVPEFQPLYESDIQFIISSKNVKASTDDTGLPSAINDYQFNVFGVNYYLLRRSNYKYKYGLGAEFLYDGSVNATRYRQQSEIDGEWYDVTRQAPFTERLALGLSAKGEIVKPLYTVFANVGYTVIQADDSERFYQSIGVKVPLKENLYGTFCIRAKNFSQAQILYWSLGYIIPSRRE